MTTTQGADPNERVHHPRHYNQHASGIECIELIEHLPCNFANSVKYVWRYGLKQSETPLRDLRSARWYTERERQRIETFELGTQFELGRGTGATPPPKTDVVWRSLARRVVAADPESALSDYLIGLLQGDFNEMLTAIDTAILEMTS